MKFRRILIGALFITCPLFAFSQETKLDIHYDKVADTTANSTKSGHQMTVRRRVMKTSTDQGTNVVTTTTEMQEIKATELFVTRYCEINAIADEGTVFVCTSEKDANVSKKFVVKPGATSVPLHAPDKSDFIIQVYASDDDMKSEESKETILVKVAQNDKPSGVALTGIGYRGPSVASGFTLTPVFNGAGTVVNQRITKSYLDTFDLNFSAGIQFLFDEQDFGSRSLQNLLSFGISRPGHNRFGFMLSINQPADGGGSSFRLGPLIYLNRDMDTALSYGLEAFQGTRFQPGTYNFGDLLAPDGTVNPNATTKKWFTGFYFGFVYKVAK